jgi:hypothetical protein
MLGYEELSELLDYNPEDGEVRWKKRVSLQAVPGQLAGTISNGYREVKVYGKLYKCHRIAWLLTHGEWPDGEIDHIDHNKSNNRVENLRLVDRIQNCRNRSRNRDDGKCSTKYGLFGVRRLPSGKWRADIGGGGKLKILGVFDDYFDAVCARKSAEVALDYHDNHGFDKHEIVTAKEFMSAKRLRGVSWDKSRQKWGAHINVNGKHISVGRYEDWFDAVCARKSAENKYLTGANNGGVVAPVPNRKNPGSGVTGVSFYNNMQKWCATFTIPGSGGKKVQLGFYEDFNDAVEARRNAESRFGSGLLTA